MLWLPRAFPDELLISRLIRFVTLFGWSGLFEIYNLLGSRKISIHPLMTASLRGVTSKNVDEANLVLRQQTLAPLFMYCLPRHAGKIKSALLAGDSSKALRGCQFPSFGSESSLILKDCSLCAEEDIASHGVAYWHRMHQIPGVNVCASHKVFLNISVFNQRQRLIAGYLPEPLKFCRPAGEEEVHLAQFSKYFLQFLSNNQISYPAVIIYRKKLYQDGFITKNGHLRHHNLMSAFYNDIRNSIFPGNLFIPKDENNYGYLYHLLNAKFSIHPGKHLLFAYWLFHSAENMLDFTQSLSEGDSTVGNTKKIIPEPDIDFTKILSKNISMNRMSVISGKSRCYIKRIAALQGINLERHPKKLTKEIRKQIEWLGYLGFHRKVIAERCKIGIGSVESAISSCNGLVERRKLCHYQSFLRRSKFKIVQCRKIFPNITRSEVRKKYSAEFFWLYHHEKKLLESVLPPATHSMGCKKQKNTKGLDNVYHI